MPRKVESLVPKHLSHKLIEDIEHLNYSEGLWLSLGGCGVNDNYLIP